MKAIVRDSYGSLDARGPLEIVTRTFGDDDILEALAQDAPSLHVVLVARMSGVLATTGDVAATDAVDATG